MLKIKNISKAYNVAGQKFVALDKFTLDFKSNEFVAMLGPSGSGKTTLLNIIGGLDRYDSGDLLIDGKSTQDYKDQEWDAYRNSAIGFVFQNYNLISHLSILDNVEMSLRLSGVNSKERYKRATQSLAEVGLIEHIGKRPNQLSGGQMQRVAIARALVNNPKILLADEPTGALDSKTSAQIMKLIQKISKDRLVIMVTHNSEIAKKYADRIVNLLDGKVLKDSKPPKIKELTKKKKLISKRTSMSIATALKSSFKNLLTKKGRTIVTTFAGSIGIIGIALVLAISNGMRIYVAGVQSDTLADFPLQIQGQITRSVFEGGPTNPNFPVEDPNDPARFPTDSAVYSFTQETRVLVHTNKLDEEFIGVLNSIDKSLYNSITYTRSLPMHIVAQTDEGTYIKVNVGSVSTFGAQFSNANISELPSNSEYIQTQYDVLSGRYPLNANEIVLTVDEKNRVNVNVLNAFGIKVLESFSFDDLIGRQFKWMPNNLFYAENSGLFAARIDYEQLFNHSDAVALEVVGILRIKPTAAASFVNLGFGYTGAFTDFVINTNNASNIVTTQLNNTESSVLTGLPFNVQLTQGAVLRQIGGSTNPNGVNIYATSFDNKELIKDRINEFNEGKESTEMIVYTDLAANISNTVTSLIDTITVILSAFAAISLIVSSIMIGIITYVSVVERTKEIGIMRSIGARKKDISRIFNAETFIIGLGAGLLGVTIAYLITLPANIAIANIVETNEFAQLFLIDSIILVALSTLLTLVAGLIPSGIAARKDPVIALRTE
jgi:putative ABC transport system permease protein